MGNHANTLSTLIQCPKVLQKCYFIRAALRLNAKEKKNPLNGENDSTDQERFISTPQITF